MTAKQLESLLEELGACSGAREWQRGKSLAVAWNTCERGDHLLWFAMRMAGRKGWPTRKQVILAACDCAELALAVAPKNEKAPANAISTVRRWARGKATLREVRAAADACANAATYAAATYAAANTAYYAYATYAAYCAANAAAYAANAAAYAAASGNHLGVLKHCADLVRKRLKIPTGKLKKK